MRQKEELEKQFASDRLEDINAEFAKMNLTTYRKDGCRSTTPEPEEEPEPEVQEEPLERLEEQPKVAQEIESSDHQDDGQNSSESREFNPIAKFNRIKEAKRKKEVKFVRAGEKVHFIPETNPKGDKPDVTL